MSISLIDIEEIMPKKVVQNDFFGEEEIRSKNRMFSGSVERRHIERDENASDYFAQAAKILLERLNINPSTDIEMILTNVSLPDEAFTGCGAVVNKKIGSSAKWIFDIHNTGCVSFVYLMDMAKTYMEGKGVKNALICIGQTAGGRVFGQEDTRQYAQSAIPGDGFAVAYLDNSSKREIIATKFKNFPQFSEDMSGDYQGRKWWEARSVTGKIDFNEDRAAAIVSRGNRAVPEMIKKACEMAHVKTSDINFLITNQPNLTFLRNWREAIQLPPEKHLHTFEKYANLFGAGIPVTLSEAVKNRTIQEGDLVCLAGFSHACDFSGAALIRW
ncbi:MAG: 3-oxoacyl-ACP synthase III family protein [Bacteriovoracaceae bacterium]